MIATNDELAIAESTRQMQTDPRGNCNSLRRKWFVMTTMIVFHEVKNGELWGEAWRKGKGSRHEMFARIGVKARTFHDPKNPDLTGVILEIPDMAKCQAFLESDEAKKAMAEDGLRVETMRTLVEFTP